MTEHRTMNTIIHAAFRRDLARFDRALTRFPADSRVRAEQLTAAWRNFAGQLHHHHQDEETIFFPAFRELGVDESVIAELDAEHAAMAAALDAASASMLTLHAEPSADNAAAARRSLDRLTTVMQTHLEHEERDLEPFAVEHASTPQLKRAQSAVRKAHRGGVGTFFAWLADGADPATAAALRREVPAPILFAFARVGGRRYRRDVAPVWI